MNILLKNNFNRNDCIISIGGGILGDLTAFAASIFKRGLLLHECSNYFVAQ